jgi:uncharacterized membrane protein
LDPEERERLLASREENEAYELAFRVRLWKIGVPAFATLACIVCLYTCEDCLIGVMIFCVALCFMDWVLVLVFIVSLVLLIMRHPMDSKSMHRVINAGYEFIKTE